MLMYYLVILDNCSMYNIVIITIACVQHFKYTIFA